MALVYWLAITFCVAADLLSFIFTFDQCYAVKTMGKASFYRIQNIVIGSCSTIMFGWILYSILDCSL